MKNEYKIDNFYICSFLLPSERSIQILNRAFQTKHFKIDRDHNDLYSYKRRLEQRVKFDTYFPNTLSILIDKKINTIKEINDILQVSSTDIPLKYIKGIIVPERQVLSNPLMYNLFLGKYDIDEYLSDGYTDLELYQMMVTSNRSTSELERENYITGYYSALDRMMSESGIYIPQLLQDESNPKQLVKR